MKWVTREKARVDRIACPWLIARFIDQDPTFLFVAADQVMAVAAREGATPYDVPAVRLGHHGDRCSFDAFLEEYRLEDPALHALALIVRGADTTARHLSPESPGLYAAASGFQAIARDDFDNMARQFPLYDALYAHCRSREDTILFVCLHGAAKSLVAASHLQRLAAERGVRLRADFAGTEPDPELTPAAVEGLRADGIDVRARWPRRVTLDEIRRARRVVSFGCDLGSLAPGVEVERWDDVPPVSEDYRVARDVIVSRLPALLDTAGPTGR